MSSISSNLRSHISDLMHAAREVVAPGVLLPIVLERPKSAQHGDYASNLAMQLAKPMKRNPRNIEQALIAAMPPSPLLHKVEIAGAGFVNLYLKPVAKQGVVQEVLEKAQMFGRLRIARA